MAYSVKSKKSGKMYHLHSKEVKLAAGRKQRIFYFAGVPGKDALNALPEGYEVFENERTGLPMLRKIGGAAKKKAAPKKAKVAKKAVVKKAPVKKAPVKKVVPKKAPVKKAAVKKAAPKRPAKKVAPKKAAIKKKAPKKAIAKKRR